jgi:hypothetical protein
MTTPAMVVPWPPIHLVALCTTMSAPCSIGRIRYPEIRSRQQQLNEDGGGYGYLPCQKYCLRSVGPCARVRPLSHLNAAGDTTTNMGSHTLAISLIGLTLYFGFPMLSMYTALVFSSIAAAISVGSSDVTNFTPIPYFLKNTTPAVSPGSNWRDRGFYP